MSPQSWFVTALFLVPAVALLSWVWFTMARVESELGRVGDFEGRHFDIGTQPSEPATPPADLVNGRHG